MDFQVGASSEELRGDSGMCTVAEESQAEEGHATCMLVRMLCLSLLIPLSARNRAVVREVCTLTTMPTGTFVALCFMNAYT